MIKSAMKGFGIEWVLYCDAVRRCENDNDMRMLRSFEGVLGMVLDIRASHSFLCDLVGQ